MISLDDKQLREGALEGTFTQFELPAVLVRAARNKTTGCLVLVGSSGTRRRVAFVDGYVAVADSDDTSEHLCARMLENGKLSFEQEAEVHKAVEERQISFEEALLSLGLTDSEELRRTLQWYQRWMLRRCLAEEQVRCSLVPLENPAVKTSGLPLLRCIEDGIRDYGAAQIEELQIDLDAWRFSVPGGELEFAREFGCSNAVGQILEGLATGSWGFRVVVASAGSDGALAAAITVALCGLASSQPRAIQGETGGERTPAPEEKPEEEPAPPAEPEEPRRVVSESRPSPLGQSRPVAPPVQPRVPPPMADSDDDDFNPWVEDEVPPGTLMFERRVAVAAAAVVLAFGFAGGWIAAKIHARPAPASTASPEPTPEPPREKAVTAVAAAVKESEEPPEAPPEANKDEVSRMVSEQLELGHQYLQNKQPYKAMAAYKKAMALDPKAPLPHRSLGVVYQELGRLHRAAKEYKIYLELDPNSEEAPTLRQIIAEIAELP